MKAQRREADPQITRRTSKLGQVLLQFRLGFMQGCERRARQLELARRFERDRRLALAESDHIAVVKDRFPAASRQALQQVANRAWMAIRRQIGRRGQIRQAEAELLVLGADTK